MEEDQYVVVGQDNFGRSGETPVFDEWFKITADRESYTKSEAEQIVVRLNGETDKYGPHFYRMEKLGYNLRVFEP